MVIIENKTDEWRKNNVKLKNQLMTRKSYDGKWVFIL